MGQRSREKREERERRLEAAHQIEEDQAEQRIHPFFIWMRNSGILSAFCGGIAVICTARFFWWSVTLIHVGVLFFGIDLWAGEFKRHPKWKYSITLVLIGALAIFNYEVVWISTPLGVAADSDTFGHPPGSMLGGIAWQPKFGELYLHISNPSEYDDENMVIHIRPDVPVVAAEQASQLSDINLIPDSDPNDSAPFPFVRSSIGDQNIPLALIATEAGYRLYCGRLPARESIDIVMALAKIKENDVVIMLEKNKEDKALITFGNPDGVNGADAIGRVKENTGLIKVQMGMADGAQKYQWLATKLDEQFFGSSPMCRHLHIEARFEAAQRIVNRTMEISVVDHQSDTSTR